MSYFFEIVEISKNNLYLIFLFLTQSPIFPNFRPNFLPNFRPNFDPILYPISTQKTGIFDFWTNILICDLILTQYSMFDRNFDFYANFFTQNLGPKFRFLFNQKIDFLTKFWFFTKISIFDQNFDLGPSCWKTKMLCHPKVTHVWPNFPLSQTNYNILVFSIFFFNFRNFRKYIIYVAYHSIYYGVKFIIDGSWMFVRSKIRFTVNFSRMK